MFAKTGVPQEHLKRHPFGRIPAFEHGDFRLYETGAIVRLSGRSRRVSCRD
ncbi:hypothetical protein [Paraburkholderia strydomiana]